jgi:hypothetical protein
VQEKRRGKEMAGSGEEREKMSGPADLVSVRRSYGVSKFFSFSIALIWNEIQSKLEWILLEFQTKALNNTK